MRFFALAFLGSVFLVGCDTKRHYEQYVDFNKRYWLSSDTIQFEFTVSKAEPAYNLYCNIRNSSSYPYSRLFVQYTLLDSAGTALQKKLLSEYLFDAKTGKPFGRTGLGDLYDHRILLMKDYQFAKPGTYKVKLEQYMRMDTLPGIVAVGLRVEDARATE
jgi:gliding motility-associated lipoprotein GldH